MEVLPYTIITLLSMAAATYIGYRAGWRKANGDIMGQILYTVDKAPDHIMRYRDGDGKEFKLLVTRDE